MRITLLPSLMGLLFPALAMAATLEGSVTGAEDAPIRATLQINAVSGETDALGRYRITVPEAEIYRLRIAAEGHYATVQTFSAFELDVKADTPTQIPSINLVAQKAGRVLFAFGGDVMAGRRYFKPHKGEPVTIRPETQAEDLRAVYAPMKPYLELADLATLNLETQILKSVPEEKAPKSVVFHSPLELVDALQWAGVDYVTLGNNHTYDYLESGLKQTLDVLRDRGLAHSGAGLTEAEALEAHIAELAGYRYALQGYVGWAGNGRISQVAESNSKGGPPLGSAENLLRNVTRDLARGHLPIVQYHGGLEYVDGPTLMMETRMKQALDAGAVMAIGHHPHVFQGLELYEGKLIAWSLGNFAFDQFYQSTQKTALLLVWMDGDQLHRAEIVPIYVKGYVPTPGTGQMRQAILSRITRLSQQHGTQLQSNGGHAILDPVQKDGRSAPHSPTAFAPGITPLTSSANQRILVEVQPDQRYRFGRDLIDRGDFESYDLFGISDRTWLEPEGLVSQTDTQAASGSKSLKLTIPAGDSVTTGLRKFMRVYKPGTPMGLTGAIRSTGPMRVKAEIQYRRTRQGLFEALDSGPKDLIAEQAILPDSWQAFAAQFNSRRVGARGMRFLLTLTNETEQDLEVYLDDLALIEWQTPFLHRGQLAPIDASHIETQIWK